MDERRAQDQAPVDVPPEVLRAAFEAHVQAQYLRRRAWRSFIIGLAIAIVGGLITLATYASASEAAATGSGDTSYYVMWGLVLFGGIKMLRALQVLFTLRRFRRAAPCRSSFGALPTRLAFLWTGLTHRPS